MTILPNKKKSHESQRKNEHHQRYTRSDGNPSTSARSFPYERDRDDMAGTSGPPARRQRLGPGSSLGGNTGSRKRNGQGGGSGSQGVSSRKTHAQHSPPGRDLEGYNSEDEYEGRPTPAGASQLPAPDVIAENERQFEEVMKKQKGYYVKKTKEDGACLFRAIADQIYGDQEMHGNIRDMCMDYMSKNRDYFSQFITEDFTEYIERKRRDNEHGNHVEIQAIAEVFNRPVEIYQSHPISLEPINTFQSRENAANPPLILSYHGRCHYNSLRDPYAANVGVGLGLPQLYPGMADRNLMREAVGVSQNEDIEKTMLEDKLRATDMEATEDQMSEQVARESYLQFMRSREQQEVVANRPCHSGSLEVASKAGTPGSVHHSPKAHGSSPKSAHGSKPNSPHSSGKIPKQTVKTDEGAAGDANWETASLINEKIPLKGFGLPEDLDADLLAQMLAISQQEYWDSLKKSNVDSGNNSDSNANKE